MSQIITLALKDLKVMVRDKSGFFFTFFFPIIIAVMFGSIFGGSGGDGGTRAMTILVIDEDSTETSAAFVQTLDDASEINVVRTNRAEAIDNVRKGKNVAFIALTEGFGEASKSVFWGDPPEVEIGVDPSRKAEAAMLQGILMNYGSKRFQKAFSDPGMMMSNLETTRSTIESDTSFQGPMKENLIELFGDLDRFFVEESTYFADAVDSSAVADSMLVPDSSSSADNDESSNMMQPLVINQVDVVRSKTELTNAYAISFPQGIIWGIIGVAAAFGISIVIERTRGTMQRLMIAPVSLSQILAGKALACFTAINAISVILLLLALTVFNVMTQSYTLLAMAVLASAICFTGIMMMLSVLGRTERSVGGIGWAVMLVFAMLGGGMVPLMFMPGWMQRVGMISPVKWAIISLEGALWRGFTFTEMLQPIGVLVGIGVMTFIIGVAVIRNTELR